MTAAVVAQAPSADSAVRRRATVEDSVRLRTFVEEQSVAVSPDGRQLAYALVEPNLERNLNETVIYICDLPSIETTAPPRSAKAILRTRGVRQLQWLADGKHLLVLHRPEGGRAGVASVDLESAELRPMTSRTLDVEAFAATPDGQRLALLVSIPDQEQTDRFASPRGVVITEDDFLLDVDVRSATKETATRTAVIAADADGGTLTIFAGQRSLGLMQPAISPDGRHVTFLALGEALPYPPNWQHDPAFREWPKHGFVVPQTEVVLAALPATLSSEPSPVSGDVKLGLALDAGCVSDYLWKLPTLWSDDSTSYLICGPTPVGDGVDEPLVGPYRPQHLFAVDVRTSNAHRIMDDTPQQILAFDELAKRIVVLTRKGELVTLRRAEATSDKWNEVTRTKLPAHNLTQLSAATDGMRRFVGIHQMPNVPPDLWLLDATSGKTTRLTEINPELSEQTLGEVERITWTGSISTKHRGYLIYPVGYESGARYPCVIMCKSWDETFIHGGNGGFIGNFAPQALANCGFVVLMLEDALGPYRKGTWAKLPGGVSEAFRAMDAFETAKRELDRRGLIDPSRVGIMGFSRSSWTVDFTITHSKEPWAAAVSADSGIYSYGTYLGDKNVRSGMAAMYGGPPYAENLKAWLDYAPAFSAGRVRTPLLMQYHGKVSMAAEFYSALTTLGKPVELVLFPKGKHVLELPLQRVGSMQGSVDWFRFWLQGHEDSDPQYPEQYTRWRKLRAEHLQNEKLLAEGKDPSKEFINRRRDAAK
jgi:dipeptidyl aminopeptidase/acylaminoacyl peptidase